MVLNVDNQSPAVIQTATYMQIIQFRFDLNFVSTAI